jgi:predicted nucleic acid-binding protein
MTPVFVDTAALIALGNRRDDFHLHAQAIKRELIGVERPFVTTSLVIVELCNAFSSSGFRSTAVQMVESLHHSKRWNVVDVDREWMTVGFELYRKMTDKEWSLVDCISILVANRLKIFEIFTTDHHFEQAGLRILLPRPLLAG